MRNGGGPLPPGEEDLRHPLLAAVGVEVHGDLLQGRQGDGLGIVGLLHRLAEGLRAVLGGEVTDAEDHLLGPVGEQVLQLPGHGGAGGDGDHLGQLLRRHPIGEGDVHLIVGRGLLDVVADVIHGVGPQGVLPGGLLAGLVHIAGGGAGDAAVLVQPDHPGLLPLLHQVEQGAHQALVVLRPQGGGDGGLVIKLGMGGHGGVTALQHGPAAGEGQGQGQGQRQAQGPGGCFHGETTPYR